MNEQKHDATVPARPDLEALRAAVARIEEDPATELSEPEREVPSSRGAPTPPGSTAEHGAGSGPGATPPAWAGTTGTAATVPGWATADAQVESETTEDGPARSRRGSSSARAGSRRSSSRRSASGGGPDATDADPYAVARAVVLRLLTGAPKSRSELEKALRRKDCPDDVAAQVLDRYTEVGLVDDEAYARTFVRSKQAGRGLARRALTHELRAKGVPDEIAEAVLDEVDPEDERARAYELVEKRLRSMHGLDRATQTRRLSVMLARKGYGHDVARLVVNETLDSQPEHQRD